MGAGPLPGAWRKCRSMPCTGTLNCGTALSRASAARQSKRLCQKATSSCSQARSVP